MGRFVGGEGVGEVGTESVGIGGAAVAVQAGGDVERHFQAGCGVEPAADCGDGIGQCAAETGAENAVDQYAVAGVQSTGQFVGGDKGNAHRTLQPAAVQLGQFRQITAKYKSDIDAPALRLQHPRDYQAVTAVVALAANHQRPAGGGQAPQQIGRRCLAGVFHQLLETRAAPNGGLLAPAHFGGGVDFHIASPCAWFGAADCTSKAA